MRFYPHFNLPMVRSPRLRVCCLRLNAHFGLGFPSAPGLKALNLAANSNSRTHSSTGTLSPPEGGSNRCVSARFQVLLTPVFPVLFIVRSRYYSLSVAEEYLALGGGPPGFTPGFPCPVLLGIPMDTLRLRYRTVTFYGGPFQTLRSSVTHPTKVPQPRQHRSADGLGSSPFARHY